MSGHGRKWAARAGLVLCCAALLGCSREEAPQPAAGSGSARPTALRADVEPAPASGEVPALVQEARDRARREGRELVVYVGASWCEPCTRFHDAVKAGQLDAAFPALRLLEFDLDRDRDRLAEAGYASEMIPLFVVPGKDGRGTPLRVEGSVKGERAVDEIVPRLGAILARARAAAR
ncbi:TlpA family protein disulfide reductase [Sorangium sp. So ce1099]|uniref:TlpA family protein disulfide reductase n=1 Tax=Sorangium sp. So ce1099 TaxID=3133331 RepID=UPI003F5F60CD